MLTTKTLFSLWCLSLLEELRFVRVGTPTLRISVSFNPFINSWSFIQVDVQVISLINPDSNLYHSSSIYISHSSTHLISAPISSTLSSLLGETLGHDSVMCGRKTCISWRSAGQWQRSWGVLRSQVSLGAEAKKFRMCHFCVPQNDGFIHSHGYSEGQNEVSKTWDKLKHELRNA